ncbi:MAG: hypothetical protein JRD87_12015 [Deltaproteobacteria bacterium]|nr:hypothetical protein [Deltaproteobacteria bacterium]MBW2670586.1 hypothetical protein [Deltaproteobacteria bacterium]
MYGFYGRILKIDLNREAFSIEPVEDEILKTCLGGRGLATRLLLDHNPPGEGRSGADRRKGRDLHGVGGSFDHF